MMIGIKIAPEHARSALRCRRQRTCTKSASFVTLDGEAHRDIARAGSGDSWPPSIIRVVTAHWVCPFGMWGDRLRLIREIKAAGQHSGIDRFLGRLMCLRWFATDAGAGPLLREKRRKPG